MDTHRTKQCRRTVTKAHFASASCQKMALKMGHARWEDEMTVKWAMTFPSGDGTVLNIHETQVGIKLQKSKSCLHQLPSANNSSLKIGFLKGLRFLFSSSYLNDAMTGDTLGCYHTSRGDFKASNTPCMQHYLAILSHTIVLCCLNIWRGVSRFVIALQPFGEHRRQISCGIVQHLTVTSKYFTQDLSRPKHLAEHTKYLSHF